MAQTPPHVGGNSALSPPRAPASSQHDPGLTVTLQPPNKVFYMTADAQMPTIKASCERPVSATNAPTALGPAAALSQHYDWDVTLILNPAGVPHAVGRMTRHTPIHVTTTDPVLALPFTQVRGGTLTITVAMTFEGKRITGKATAEILGTNPSSRLIRIQGASDLLMKLMMLESRLQQFLTGRAKAGYPVFSHDDLGGVGLGQITRPRPTEDEIWDWRVNVRTSKAAWESKRTNDARRILRNYQAGKSFLALVAAYNKARIDAPPGNGLDKASAAKPAVALKPLSITLPDVTEEMIDNEALRLYNGAPVVQEYVAETDSTGLLVVDIDKDGLHGKAQWHQVTAAERRALYLAHGMKAETGDPDYVNDVRAQVLP